MSRIGLDLDGVVYNFADAHRTYLVEHLHLGPRSAFPDPRQWNTWESWGLTYDEWARTFEEGIAAGVIFGGGKRFLYEGALWGCRALVMEHHELHIVTNRPDGAQEPTRAWLDEIGLPYESITFTADKASVPVDVMIEDNVDNALACIAAGSVAILVDRPWNRTWPVGGESVIPAYLPEARQGRLVRAYGWEEVVDKVNDLGAYRQRPAPVDLGPIGDPVTDERGNVTPNPMTVDAWRRGAGCTDTATFTPSPTGGVKGQKAQQVHQIPVDFLLALGAVYTAGNAKYPDAEPGRPNWSRGYDWSLSYSALHRHAAAFWRGEWLDPEDGQPHVVKIAWHAATLYTFHEEGLGTDDRPAYYRAAS